MTTGEQLHRGIILRPDDTPLRLVYADWLEDHGDGVIAEFIRAQCELDKWQAAEGAILSYDAPGLRERERELLDGVCGLGVEALPIVEGLTRSNHVGNGHYGWWHHGDASGPHHGFAATFRRGFVEQVACSAGEWLTYGPAIVSVNPVREVRLTDVWIDRGDGVDRPSLALHGVPMEIARCVNQARGTPIMDAVATAGVVYARRKAGLDVRCHTCASEERPGWRSWMMMHEQMWIACDRCNGTGWRVADC
jgi:uncharacterized protein (TIGR02996 family)